MVHLAEVEGRDGAGGKITISIGEMHMSPLYNMFKIHLMFLKEVVSVTWMQ